VSSLALLDWLEQRGGLAGALLVASMWLLILLRERTNLARRTEQLSDALCRSIESGSAERSRLADEYRLAHDWTVRSLLEHFTALATRREIWGAATPIGLKTRAESDPPPLPPIPQPPKRTR
jgi:hypothetical protein